MRSAAVPESVRGDLVTRLATLQTELHVGASIRSAGGQKQDGSCDPRKVGFLLIPGFSLMSYVSAIEPFRAANQLSGRMLYRWHHISPDDRPVNASTGLALPFEHKVGDAIALDMIFVCAAGNPARFDHAPTLAWLRALARRETRIGGISGGTYVLARAGLLYNRRVRFIGTTSLR